MDQRDAIDRSPAAKKAALPLTRRETEVLALLLRGLENKEIAYQLGIAEPSVKQYVSQLFQKFDVPNRAALAATASRMELSGELGIDIKWLPQFFRNAEPMIVVGRGPDIRYEAANDSWIRSVGDRPFIGRTMRETFPELDGQGIFETVERVYATGEAVVEHEVVRNWDRGNGIERRLVDQVIQPLHDEHGAVNGIMSFALDVTDLVEPHRQADLIREEHATLLELLSSGVIVVDELGQIVTINEAARRITRGVEFDLDRPLYTQGDTFEPRDGSGRPIPSDEQPVARAVRGETVVDEELTFLAGDPPRRTRAKVSARPLRDPDGRIRGAILVFTEV